jgi:hypothetical protein
VKENDRREHRAAVLPAAAESKGRQKQTKPSAIVKEPCKGAMTVYRYWLATGKKQTELAQDEALTALLERTVSQGTISRWLRQVETWIKAGNILPDLRQSSTSKPKPMDPERIDLGRHGEHRPKHQRNRRSSDGDE